MTVESGALIETRAAAGTVVPAIVAAAGDGAARRFLEFFAVTIENPNTRAAYFHAAGASSPGARRATTSTSWGTSSRCTSPPI